ncbi:sigma-70 family RNA polymerase sigma factor [Leucobacter viscericola]|uniref:Sigma-70 family RNA polymerase sigma factor n=1 Tax=Leucobacter viscericola TaxID=2714935 RepID=A0A6G7XI67_9MICO|nr:sigma-70 family RNA polymerase sigma factor [Leucobacter viscericola]QIK64300.1 sigma-70 family RNA polymerase sigma factor [Leucobacter viscericola]
MARIHFGVESDDSTLLDIVGDPETQEHLRQEAFAELYERYRRAAYVRALRLVDSPHRAEDVVAEAFVKTLAALRRGLGPTQSFAAYLFTAVRSEAFRSSQTDRSTETLSDQELAVHPNLIEDDFSERLSERDQLMAAFRALTRPWQHVLWLTEVEGITNEEVGEELGITTGAAAALGFRAREGLRVAYLQLYSKQAAPECAGLAALLAGYLRGGLGKRDRARVEGHLLNCGTCVRQLAELKRLNQSLRLIVGPLLAGGTAASLALVPKDSAAAVGRGAGLVPGGGLRVVVAGFLLAAAIAGVLLLTPQEAQPQMDNGRTDSAGAELNEVSRPTKQDIQAEKNRADTEPEPAKQEVDESAMPAGDDTTPNWALVE